MRRLSLWMTGWDALTELRTLIGALRNPEESTGRSPQPTAAGLHELAERVRELGLPVNLRLTGDFEGVPAGLGLGVYRIVQESLTNALKHGARTQGAIVSIDNDGHRIQVEVLNGTAERPTTLASGGNGLIGMRERASVYGRTLEAGPRPEGGWRVLALLPATQVQRV